MIHLFSLKQLKEKSIILNNYKISFADDFITIDGRSCFVYGLGERFDQVNQKDKIIKNVVEEKFCYQGDKTYFPIPFLILEGHLGLFIDTKKAISFHTGEPLTFEASLLDDSTKIYFFTGSYQEIQSDYISLSKTINRIPTWALGPWISAHRWKSESMIDHVRDIIKKIDIPVSALVIEQWSDEATFYIFNGASYDINKNYYSYDDFDFDPNGLWPNPKAMIERLHNDNIRVLLWQIPVIKALEEHESFHPRHELDRFFIEKNELVVKNDGGFYKIPKGHWFAESYVADFTNPQMIDWWFKQRKYLSDIGVDGFKTDGGEHIHSSDCQFYDGSIGVDMKNDFSRLYTNVYKDHLNANQVLFSRAGYHGSKSSTILWAGDQKSTWDELKNIYQAGLSASLSGQALWGFDIGGFAGELPSFELYVRATELAVFVPIMQCHSEPVGGQFASSDPSKIMNNERTPWHIASHYQKENLLHEIIKLYYMRMHLLPSIDSFVRYALTNNQTVMSHLIMHFDEEYVKFIDDQHMFGNIMVIPVLDISLKERTFFLPKGTWVHLLSNERLEGGKFHTLKVELFDLMVFVQEKNALLIQGTDLTSPISNDLSFDNLSLFLYGKEGSQSFYLEDGNISIEWNNQSYFLHDPNCKIKNVFFK